MWSFFPLWEEATCARYWMTFFVFSVLPAPDSPLWHNTHDKLNQRYLCFLVLFFQIDPMDVDKTENYLYLLLDKVNKAFITQQENVNATYFCRVWPIFAVTKWPWHWKTKNKIIKSSKPRKILQRSSLDLEHSWGFTLSAYWHTPTMHKILFSFQTGRFNRKDGGAVCVQAVSLTSYYTWRTITEGLRQCLCCWPWTAMFNILQLLHLRRLTVKTMSADLITSGETSALEPHLCFPTSLFEE